MSWHCDQIPNGDAPIVVCKAEDLRAERDALVGAVRSFLAVWDADPADDDIIDEALEIAIGNLREAVA